jgi:hypothetical protein
MVLIFKYNDKVLKFFPHNNDLNLKDYANNNLPNGTPYKILYSINNLTDQDLITILNDPDGYSNNSNF